MYFKCRVEFARWALKTILQNSLGDLCSVWDAMNSMISTHVSYLNILKLKHPLKQVHMWLDMFLKLPYTRGFMEWFQGML